MIDAVTRNNWRERGAQIHEYCMKKMGVAPGHFNEILFLSLATAGEAGEVADAAKKLWRDGESPELWRKFEDEVADVYIYLEHLVKAKKLDVDFICARKLEEVRHRPFAGGEETCDHDWYEPVGSHGMTERCSKCHALR